jgi:lysophospholipase L1-like esterase
MEPRDWHPDPFRVLVTLGESTTAGGWSSTPDRCWAPLLAQLISDFQDNPVTLINTGIGANVISNRVPSYEKSGKPAANERLEKHVIAHDPDLLVVSYGLNDARAGTPVEMFRDELTQLLTDIRERCNPLIVLLGPYYMTAFSGYRAYEPYAHGSHEIFKIFNLATQQVAAADDCLYCDVYNTYNEASWMVHDDAVHANDLGHRIIANEIFKVLAQHCSGLAIRTKQLEKISDRWRDESVLKADYGHKTKELPAPGRPSPPG